MQNILKILFLYFFLFSNTLLSCDCPPVEKLEKKLINNFDAIFFGKVDSVGLCNAGKYKVYFLVADFYKYKGKATKTIIINADCSSDCQMNFLKNENWLVYSNYEQYGLLEASFCSRTRKYFDKIQDDYYSTSLGLSLEDELEFLTKNSVVQVLSNSIEQPHRELIKPNGISLIGLILVSLSVILILFFFLKRLK